MRIDYQCEATSVAGFIQQLAVAYVARGYFFYVTGLIPERKNPSSVDAKLIDRYDIAKSKWSRARRKRAGHASVQYLRYNRRFLILATHGEHPIFAEEAESLRDCRRVPVKVFGYAISYKRERVHVRIELNEYKRLQARLLDFARHRKANAIADAIANLPYEPYAPVRRQLLLLLKAVNAQRRSAGYEQLPWRVLRFRRRIVKPFEVQSRSEQKEEDVLQDSELEPRGGVER